MWLQSNNINKVREVTVLYIELILQVVFRIWFLYPALYWEVNKIHDLVNKIQL